MAIQKTETSVNLRINQLNKKMFDDALAAGEISNTEMYVVEEADDPSSTALFDAAVYNDDVPPNIGEVDPTGLELILKQDFILQNLYNPNLLDNSNFADIVNQRGLIDYTTNGYAIDRWMIYGGALTVDLTHRCCHLTAQLYQKIPQPMESVYTLSVKTSDGVVTVSGDVSADRIATSGNTKIRITKSVEQYLQVTIEPVNNAVGITIYWAKLEDSPFATPYISKGYSAELLECQRYFQWHAKGFHFYLPYVGGNQWYANLPYPTEMRIIPTLTCTTVAGTFVSSASQPTRFGAKLYGGSSATASYQCILQDIILNAEL